MFQRGTSYIILIIGIFIISILGYVVYLKFAQAPSSKALPQENLVLKSPEPESTSSAQMSNSKESECDSIAINEGPLKGWKKYTNTQFGVQISYPDIKDFEICSDVIITYVPEGPMLTTYFKHQDSNAKSYKQLQFMMVKRDITDEDLQKLMNIPEQNDSLNRNIYDITNQTVMVRNNKIHKQIARKTYYQNGEFFENNIFTVHNGYFYGLYFKYPDKASQDQDKSTFDKIAESITFLN